MALVVYDRVQETTTTTGTGTITLAGAVSGFQSFAVVGNGNTTYYCITSGTAWEVGIGTYTSSGTTLARTTVLSNSLGTTSAISLTGTSNVFVTYPSEKSVNQDATGVVTVPVLATNSTTNTTPVLSFNASNSGFAMGATVATSYLQTLVQNKSGTAGASTNYVLSNDLGTDSTYYGEFGMNSSVFSASTPADFFSINNSIYFSGHDGDLAIGSGNGFKTYLAWGTTGQSAHVINASGAIGLNTNLGTTPALSGTTNFGTSGQVLQSAGSAATPTWSSTPTLTGTNFTGIPNGALTNNAITFGATSQTLGSTVSALNAVSIGATTASSGAFTTLSASSTVSGTGFSTYLASPPAIGGTAAAAGTFTALTATGVISHATTTNNQTYSTTGAGVISISSGTTGSINNMSIGATTASTGAFTTLSASSTVSGTGFSTYLASPPAIGGTAAAAGSFTTLSASSTVSGTGFSTYLASPPAIGGTAAAAITGTTITANTAFSGPLNGTVGATTPNTGAFTTLSASSTVSGTGFSTYLASPPAIGGTAPASITGTAIIASNGIVVNNKTVATSYSIPSGYSAMSAGPMTVNSGVTVTVPTGSKWVVL